MSDLAADEALEPWPSTGPGALTWRRVMRLWGRMPVELVAGDAVIGRLIATDLWAREYRVDTRDAAWRFSARGFWRRRFLAYPGAGYGGKAPGPGGVLARADRAGVRRRRVRIGAGPLLDWRQLGVQGSTYRLALPHDGAALLIARNTGGPLRWRGTVELHDPAHDLGPALPLLVLFSVFLVFNSGELGS